MVTKKLFRVLLSFCGWLLTFFIFFQIVLDADLGLHLNVGRYVVEHGRPPKTDIFSFSLPDYPYVYHSWLSQTLVYLVYRWRGLLGVTFLYACLGVGYVRLLVAVARRLGAWANSIIFKILIAGTVFYAFYLRVQLFSLLGTGMIFYTYLVSVKASKRAFWWWPVIFAFWVNLHGGFVFGLGFGFTLLLMELLVVLNRAFLKQNLLGRVDSSVRMRRWLMMMFVWGLSVTACLLNPYGLRVFEQAARMGTSQYVPQFNIDWSPLVSVVRPSSKLFALLLFSMSSMVLLLKSKISWQLRGLVLAFLYLTVIMNRFSLGLITILFPSFWLLVEQSWRSLNLDRKNLNRLVGLGFICLLALIMEIGLNVYQLYRAIENEEDYVSMLKVLGQPYSFPLGAADYLREHESPERIFNNYNWGGYLVWKIPDRKVFIHGFMDHYYPEGRSFAEEYFDALSSIEAFKKTAEKYQLDGCLLSDDFSLTSQLRADEHWQVIFEDEVSVLFGRLE